MTDDAGDHCHAVVLEVRTVRTHPRHYSLYQLQMLNVILYEHILALFTHRCAPQYTAILRPLVAVSCSFQE